MRVCEKLQHAEGQGMAKLDHGIKRITDTSARELRVSRVWRASGCGPWRGRCLQRPNCWRIAFRASHGRERFLVYFEFYTCGTGSAWDMLAKSGLLSQRLRLPTVCLAFVLFPRRVSLAGRTIPTGSGGCADAAVVVPRGVPVATGAARLVAEHSGADGPVSVVPPPTITQEAVQRSAALLQHLACPLASRPIG